MLDRLPRAAVAFLLLTCAVLVVVGVGVALLPGASPPTNAGLAIQFGSFAGYQWSGDAQSISAAWTVPTLGYPDRSAADLKAIETFGAHAATWIGLQGTSDFIQVGIDEDQYITPAGRVTNEYTAFWSDTAVSYRA